MMLRRVAAAAVLAALVVVAASSATPQRALPSNVPVVLFDQTFKCADYVQPLDIPLLRVVMTKLADTKIQDAVWFSHGECSGVVHELEVDVFTQDGVKVGETAHDLTIEGGYIAAHDRTQCEPQCLSNPHQDGIQALGGTNVTFKNLVVHCESCNHAALYYTRGANGALQPTPGDWPTNEICTGCVLYGGGDTVHIGASIQSGVVNSRVFKGHYRAIRIAREAVRPVNAGNTVLGG